MSGGMREQMPQVAAFIDELRAAFGQADIDNVIRRGLHADCKPMERFHAIENGQTLGQAYIPECQFSASDMVIRVPEEDEPVTEKKRGRR